MPVENAWSLGGRTIVKHSDSTTNSRRWDSMSISPEMDYPVYLRSQPSKSRFFRSRYFVQKITKQDLKKRKSKKSTKVKWVRCFKPGGGSHSMPQSLFFSSSFRCWGPRKKLMPF